MKIGVADNCGGKFSREIIDHWIKKGHEVRYERGASEFISQWADMYYFDWSDNNIHYIYKLYHDQLPDYPNGSSFHKPKIVVRAIDWDIWIGHARSKDIVDFVDQWICIAPHMEKKLRNEAEYKEGQLVCIQPGVNTEKFPIKQKQTDGFQLGMVLGDMWVYKNHMAGLDIFTTLYRKDNRWRLHIRGQHEPGEYNPVMFEHYLISRGIKDAVTLYAHTDDMNTWYENIDYLLHTGMKEAFCYAVAESMSKGIPCVVNQFYGSEKIWPDWCLYTTHEHAVNKILGLKNKSDSSYLPIEPLRVREYIKTTYSIKKMLSKYDELLGT